MDKRGQVTLFMIIAMIILVFGVIYFYFGGQLIKEKAEIEKSIKIPLVSLQVKTFTESCLRKILDDGIILVSKQGGYYNPPFLSTTYLGNKVAYFYHSQQNLAPSIGKIKSEISKYVYDNLNQCLEDFKSFKEQGLKIEWEIKNISIEIIEGAIVLKALLPIKIVIDDAENYISDFRVTINKKLKTFYDIANDLVKSQEQEPNSVLIGKLIDLGLLNNITYDIVTQGNDVIYVLIDEEPFVDDGFEFERDKELYYFVFASKYNWNISDKEVLALDMIPNLTAYVDYDFNYQINANLKRVEFFDSTDLFDIEPKSGIIKFTPKNYHTGEHLVLMGVKDIEGNIDTQTFMINIIEGNKKPFINPIVDLTAFVNKTFVYYVNASDPENLTILYTDDTNLFDIGTLNGVINFTPKISGTFKITITATDINGASDRENFYLTIKNE